MPQQKPRIRLAGLFAPDAPFIPGNPDVPTPMRERSDHFRLVIFELYGRMGINSHIAIPVAMKDDDAMITEARAALYEMLLTLSEESHIWRPTLQEGGGTP